MLLDRVSYLFCFLLCCLLSNNFCDGQVVRFRNYYETTAPPLPFPSCKAIDIDCLRRGIRTFFIMMDSGYLGMKAVDPTIINSVAVAFPDQQLTFLMRRVNVTGARWTKLVDRQFNLPDGKNGVIFNNDLHVTGEITMRMADRLEPYVALIAMDIHSVESNITYSWDGIRGYDKEDYLEIGQERIAVRNIRLPTYFIQPDGEAANVISEALNARDSILDHLSNEIVTSVMQSIVDNFRQFTRRIPVRHYYRQL